MKKCMDSDNLHRRLNKIIGQLKAIDRMIDEDIPCEDILMQINASKSALHKVAQIVLEGHINHCVKEGIKSGNSKKTIEDFTQAIEYYSRI
jgi:DNA-binding FrmR family transcriptional regulator